MEKFEGDFVNWTSVQEAFGKGYIGYCDGLDVPEPDNLIVADYHIDGYEGDANVLWRNDDGTFGYVSGCHCSCYGLEDQWEVEELTKEMIEKLIEANEKWSWSFWNRFADGIKAAINA